MDHPPVRAFSSGPTPRPSVPIDPGIRVRIHLLAFPASHIPPSFFLLPSSWPPDLLRSQWGKPRHMGGVSASRPHRKTPFWGRPRERTGSNLPPEDGGIRSGMPVPDSSKPIQSPGHGTAQHAARGRGRGRGRCPTAVHPISRFPSPLCGMRRKAEVMTHAPKPLLPCIGPTHYTRRLRSHALHASCQGGTRGRTMSARG